MTRKPQHPAMRPWRVLILPIALVGVAACGCGRSSTISTPATTSLSAATSPSAITTQPSGAKTPPPVCGKAEAVYRKYQPFSGNIGYGPLRAAIYNQIGWQYVGLSTEATGSVKTDIDALSATFLAVHSSAVTGTGTHQAHDDADIQHYQPIDETIARQYQQLTADCAAA